ncbi:2-oxoglutarate-dependent dioxygenase 19-like [Cannabis sativa]|uniref:2-oxoglutarate-dependent dioxygenase 19-like n=1 Tax=Cannabis sativa TaxID=3483 RepID=UPI0029CA9BB9|nr:2-oxoglutarate-dependent dioxygenase 19-like [Cannabis sativa]
MEDPNLLASKYEFAVKPSDEEVVDLDNIEYSIPTIDFSLLTSDNLDQRSKILDDLRKACEDWGFFTLINHGISDSVMKKMMEVSESFFNMGEEEKKEFEGNGDILDPICYGTNINCNIGGKQVLFWRNFIKFIAHPQFESPYKPIGFREAAEEYGKRTREICGVLMRGISKTLGLEENCIEKATNLDMGLQYLLMNDYQSCPNPDQVIGLPPHTDPALMNILIQNDVGGLQILHNGKWVNWKAMPYSIIVDIGDQMQILTNDLYKSVKHSAIVNNKSRRISIVSTHGPQEDTKVVPIQELLEAHGQTPSYKPIPFKQYMQILQSPQVLLQPPLNLIRL